MHAKINFNILKLLITIIKIYKFFPAQIDFLIFLNQTIKNPNKFFFIPFDKVFFYPFTRLCFFFLNVNWILYRVGKLFYPKKYKICVKFYFFSVSMRKPDWLISIRTVCAEYSTHRIYTPHLNTSLKKFVSNTKLFKKQQRLWNTKTITF